MQWGNHDQWRIFSKQQSGCINLNSRGSHTGAAQYVLAKYYYFTEAVVRQLCHNILLKAVMGLLFPAVGCSVWISCTTSHWWCDAHLLRFGHCSLHDQVYMHHAQEYIRGSNSFPVFSVYFWPLYNACSHYLLHSSFVGIASWGHRHCWSHYWSHWLTWYWRSSWSCQWEYFYWPKASRNHW